MRAEILHPEPQGLRGILEGHDTSHRAVEVGLVHDVVVLDRVGDAGDVSRIVPQPFAGGVHHAPLGDAERFAVLPGERHDLC